jgi:hypothetical protein
MKTSGVFERKVLQLMTIMSLLPKIFQLLFLAYSRTLKILFFFDLASSLIKMATHAFFNKGMNNLADALPNAQALCFVSPNGEVSIDYPALSPRNLEVTDDPLHCQDSIRQAIKRVQPSYSWFQFLCLPCTLSLLTTFLPSLTTRSLPL